MQAYYLSWKQILQTTRISSGGSSIWRTKAGRMRSLLIKEIWGTRSESTKKSLQIWRSSTKLSSLIKQKPFELSQTSSLLSKITNREKYRTLGWNWSNYTSSSSCRRRSLRKWRMEFTQMASTLTMSRLRRNRTCPIRTPTVDSLTQCRRRR